MRTFVVASICFVGTFGSLNAQLFADTDDDTKRELAKSTHVYKTVGEINIAADVYRIEGDVKRPVVVWLHGGALIMGSRSGVPMQIKNLCLKKNYVLVSLDYRLAPEAKLSEIIDDLKDGLNWVRKFGPEKFGADASKMVVAGASAGGYLTMMSGFVIEPPPTALVAYWGFGDIDGDWTNTPNENYRKGKLVSKEDAWKGVGQQVLTNSDKSNGRGRAVFFNYLKQNGLWSKVLTGIDRKTDREKLAPFCPIRNLSKSYPPIMMLHGTADIDVPVEQSLNMAKELKRLELPYELITIENGGHGLWGGDKKLVLKAFADSVKYIDKQLSEQ